MPIDPPTLNGFDVSSWNDSDGGIEDPDEVLRRLAAELQAWLNHPSGSTWSEPPRERE